MKHILPIVGFMAITGFAVFTVASSDSHASANGAPAGYTGSPADGATCTSCHNSSASSITGAITSDIPATGYVNGATYNFSATISGGTVHGFEISPQASNGAVQGTLINGTSGSKLISSSKYITHTSPASGAKTWTFQWKAPTTGTANVVFYGTFVLGNGNNSDSGDQVRKTTYTVSASSATGIEDQDKPSPVSIFPNPVTDVLQVRSDISLKQAQIVSMDGKLVKEVPADELNTGHIQVSDLTEGVYFIRGKAGESNYSFKFIRK